MSTGGPLPAYLVKGGDAVLRGDAVRSLVAELVGDGDTGLMVEEHEPGGDDDDASALVDAARTPPLFTERRIVVGREVGAYPATALAALLAYLGDPSPTTSLVLVTGERGRLSTKLSTAVKAVGRVIDAGVPTRKEQRNAWLADHVGQGPVRLEPSALTLVGEHLGENLGRLTSLLETLASAYGQGSRVGDDEVRPFLGQAGAVPPWDLTDAIDRGDVPAALGALHRMTRAGERHPLQVMAVLHGHVAAMLRLDGAGVATGEAAAVALGRDPKRSAFPAKKALEQGRRLGHEGVARALALLAEADLDLRGTKGWPEELVLEVLVARLSRLAPRRRR
ncbi:MAG: DNA polymerase III subunit delta [Actinomycetota bacterium]|nr:DNA polymerase III subunit delta [Actinomycetota bacterium]